ncbi:hypothetical protein ACFSCX_19630 [Bacillus salitolerans]|uniref:Uncharacterized protein n=1 Tax=Bacillus salitolerans TaxID=1437434 RepID=A0ABW4LW35_9BACI
MSPIVFPFFMIIILIPATIYLCYILFVSISKIESAIKTILLGMHVTLIGGIIVLDTTLDIRELGYVMATIGLLISLVGVKKNK